MQKILIIIGFVFLLLGLLWPFIQKIGLGKLPGDIAIEGENFKFYFPIVTCIVVSLILSGIFWLLNK